MTWSLSSMKFTPGNCTLIWGKWPFLEGCFLFSNYFLAMKRFVSAPGQSCDIKKKKPSISDSLITHKSRRYLLLGCIGQSPRSLQDDKCYWYSSVSCDTSALKVCPRFRFPERCSVTVLSSGSEWKKSEAETTSFWEAMTILSPKFRSHQYKTLSLALTKQKFIVWGSKTTHTVNWEAILWCNPNTLRTTSKDLKATLRLSGILEHSRIKVQTWSLLTP